MTRCYGVYACEDCGFAEEVLGEGSYLDVEGLNACLVVMKMQPMLLVSARIGSVTIRRVSRPLMR